VNLLVRTKSNPTGSGTKSAERKKNAPKKTGTQTRKEEEGAAALLGLFRSDSAPAGGNPILQTSPPGLSGAASLHPGMLAGREMLAGSSRVGMPTQKPVPKRQQSKPALKRQRSQASRRSEAPEEPLLDIKLPEGNGPWEGIVVTLRHGKYKGKSAQVLGLAKKKYRVQVEGLDYQLEFYPSYVGLPEPPAPDPDAPEPDNSGALQRTTTNTSNTNIVVANVERSPSALTRVPSGSSDGSKGSKSHLTSTSLESYRSWVGKTVMVKRGKYQGRRAWVLGLASEKLRVVVDQVEHQLEYYPTMFVPPQAEDQIAPQSTSVQLPSNLLPTSAPMLARLASGASNNDSVPALPTAAPTGFIRTMSCSSQGAEEATVGTSTPENGARMGASAKPPIPAKSPVPAAPVARVDVS
jgi:ribosomal protein L24